MGTFGGVDGILEAEQVGHHGAHHSSGEAAAYQERGHQGVAGVDPVAEEVVDERLGKAAYLHIGIHVDVLDEESVGLHHLLDRDHVGMDLAPGEGLDGNVEVVGACARDLEHRCRREAGACVAVILDLDVRVFLLDLADDLAKDRGTADAGHVLKADLVRAVLDQFVHDAHVVIDGVDGGVGYGEGGLGDHAGFLGIFDRKLEVAVVVEAAEGAGDVGALLLLHLEHEFADVCGDGVHADGVEATLEHMCLDAYLVEGGGPLAD